jgi:hypothetical protein
LYSSTLSLLGKPRGSKQQQQQQQQTKEKKTLDASPFSALAFEKRGGGWWCFLQVLVIF